MPRIKGNDSVNGNTPLSPNSHEQIAKSWQEQKARRAEQKKTDNAALLASITTKSNLSPEETAVRMADLQRRIDALPDVPMVQPPSLGGVPLTQQVEIAAGRYKALGKCTTDDLAAAAKLLRDRAQVHAQAADIYQAAAALKGGE